MNIAICDDEKSCQNDIMKHVNFYFNDNKIPCNILAFDNAEAVSYTHLTLPTKA